MPTANNENAIRAEEVIARCRKLSRYSEDRIGTRRTFLSPPMHDCHRELTGWMAPLGAEVKIDAVGNFRGFYAGLESRAPRLLLGSHLDTVPNAGAFDGVLGVVIAITLLEALNGRRLPFGIEVVGFSEEEGIRFGTPFIGSRALVGRCGKDLLEHKDPRGISVSQAIEEFGLNPHEVSLAALGSDVLGYVEFHIEQGPVLETLKRPLAAVDAIVGQSRLEFTFVGRANHAGATPMHLRHDAVAASAGWISFVEREANRVPGLVATVGKIETIPGAINVIAGEVRLTLDVRHAVDQVRERAVRDLIGASREIAQTRGLSVSHNILLNQPAVALDPILASEIEQAIAKAGCEPHRMVSGAGHDAMVLAEKVPAAMILLRTLGGISHHPAESVSVDDVKKALECGLHLLDHLASSPAFQKRMCRA